MQMSNRFRQLSIPSLGFLTLRFSPECQRLGAAHPGTLVFPNADLPVPVRPQVQMMRLRQRPQVSIAVLRFPGLLVRAVRGGRRYSTGLFKTFYCNQYYNLLYW